MKEIRKYGVTAALIAVNVVIFLIMDMTGADETTTGLVHWGASYYPLIVGDGEWYRLFTCCFIHGGIEHIFGNMIALGVFGYRLEEGLGHVRMLIAYLVTGIGSSYVSLLCSHMLGEDYVSYGASGAVCGILGALLAYLYVRGRSLDGVGVKQLVFAAALIIIPNLNNPGIDNTAHISGVLIGFLVGYLLVKHRRLSYIDKL